MNSYRKTLTPEQALQKLRHFCGYQERCHSEVKEKLFTLGVLRREHDAIIAALIEDNYLNEERFAISYAGGRFRVKEWGRVKIIYELRQKQVSEYSIRKAMQQITPEDYRRTLERVAAEKWKQLQEEPSLAREKKTTAYLLQRGFEPALIREVLGGIMGK